MLLVLTPQDFKSMFGHFTTLCMEGSKLEGKCSDDPSGEGNVIFCRAGPTDSNLR